MLAERWEKPTSDASEYRAIRRARRLCKKSKVNITSNSPYNIPSISSKSKTFSYRDIISTGRQEPGQQGGPSDPCTKAPPEFLEPEQSISAEAVAPTWSEFLTPVDIVVQHDGLLCVENVTNDVSPASSSGDEGNYLFDVSAQEPDDFGLWPPSSPLPGPCRTAPSQPFGPPASNSSDFSASSYAVSSPAMDYSAGGADAAQEAADALVQFVRQHPELRGHLWSRLRTEFADCL